MRKYTLHKDTDYKLLLEKLNSTFQQRHTVTENTIQEHTRYPCIPIKSTNYTNFLTIFKIKQTRKNKYPVFVREVHASRNSRTSKHCVLVIQ